MKKLIIALSTLAAMGAGSTAFAQSGSAECQAGTARTLPRHCLSAAQERQVYGYNTPQAGDNYTHSAPAYTWVLPGLQSYAYPQYYARRYEPTRRDRDGDGVANRRDRYPYDPRYR